VAGFSVGTATGGELVRPAQAPLDAAGDRQDVQATVAGGMFVAWWPAGLKLSSLVVTGASSWDGEAYQARFDALAARGVDVHGEASMVMSLGPRSVLDAGCGTGRVAIELAHRGADVVGVDVDASMLAEARRLAPGIEWVQADLAELALGREFDVVVMAGNVPLFCPVSKRPALPLACARHVVPGGAVVAGFQLDGRYRLEEYGEPCSDAGLVLAGRWSTWDGQPFSAGGTYAVSLHRRPKAPAKVRPKY
jgi:SAM-dependent methyltransferase